MGIQGDRIKSNDIERERQRHSPINILNWNLFMRCSYGSTTCVHMKSAPHRRAALSALIVYVKHFWCIQTMHERERALTSKHMGYRWWKYGKHASWMASNARDKVNEWGEKVVQKWQQQNCHFFGLVWGRPEKEKTFSESLYTPRVGSFRHLPCLSSFLCLLIIQHVNDGDSLFKCNVCNKLFGIHRSRR